MQNRTQEDGGNIVDGSDGRQYDSGYDGKAGDCGQRPAMHIVGDGGEYVGLRLL